MDSIADVSACKRENHIKIAKINATTKTERSVQRERIKRETNMQLELAHLQHQCEEAAAQRAHEALMFDKQIALEMARAHRGNFAGHGPSLGNIDPNLR